LYYDYIYAGHGPDYLISKKWIASILGDGQIKTTITNSAEGCWDGYASHDENFTSFGSAGELSLLDPGIEAVVVFNHIDPCYSDSIEVSFRRLQMYSVISPDSVELLWERNIDSLNLSNFMYDPRLPGYFVAFNDSILNLFQGSDGKIGSSILAPSGNKHWDYPFAPDEPRLIVIQDRHVSIYRLDITVDFNDQNDEYLLPQSFHLCQNSPNPFNSSTSIGFSLPIASTVTIEVLNILGQKVKTLANRQYSAGNNEVVWDGKDDGGHDVSSGIYFYRLSSPEFTQTRKMILLK
jgi:hypothetical protein